jgi:hypothetical protein
MVLKIVTSSLLLILTSVSPATAPVAFADPSPAQVRPVASADEACWYAHCDTCGWSGPHHTGSSAEADASKDATAHMMVKENNSHTTQPKSC